MIAQAAKEYEESRRLYFEAKQNSAEKRREQVLSSKKEKAANVHAKVERAISSRNREVIQ